MARRRALLRSVGVGAALVLAGCSGTDTDTEPSAGDGSGEENDRDDTAETEPSSGGDAAEASGEVEYVTYVRNAEEVRGHLASSVELLRRDRVEDARLHAGHATDYLGALMPPVRDEDPELATRLRARLRGLDRRVAAMTADGYAGYVDREVLPLVDRAVETVVPSDLGGTTAFEVRVSEALVGRIVEEYDAAVSPDGTIEKAGEYWDARGFLGRVESRHGRVAADLDGAGTEALGRLRSAMDAVEPPSGVRGAGLRFRVETVAAAGLDTAAVDSRAEVVTYRRNTEELRGHLHSAVTLASVEDPDGALHAGHGTDYVMTVLPPVQRADPDLAGRVLDLLVAVGDGGSADRIEDDLLPALAGVEDVAVPSEYDTTGVDAAVVLALADRLVEEYDAAVTADERIELYGEYWDARGFLVRIERLFEAMRSALDDETVDRVAEELDILRTEVETTATPADVAGSVEALERALGPVVREG